MAQSQSGLLLDVDAVIIIAQCLRTWMKDDFLGVSDALWVSLYHRNGVAKSCLQLRIGKFFEVPLCSTVL